MRLIGFSVGLLAGVAAGLLLAPMRGVDFRAQVRQRIGDALDGGGGLLNDEGALEEASPAYADSPWEPAPVPLKATLGEIAQTHPGFEETIAAVESADTTVGAR